MRTWMVMAVLSMGFTACTANDNVMETNAGDATDVATSYNRLITKSQSHRRFLYGRSNNVVCLGRDVLCLQVLPTHEWRLLVARLLCRNEPPAADCRLSGSGIHLQCPSVFLPGRSSKGHGIVIENRKKYIKK